MNCIIAELFKTYELADFSVRTLNFLLMILLTKVEARLSKEGRLYSANHNELFLDRYNPHIEFIGF